MPRKNNKSIWYVKRYAVLEALERLIICGETTMYRSMVSAGKMKALLNITKPVNLTTLLELSRQERERLMGAIKWSRTREDS